ncbi:MAG: methyl-accepting chemotaxis protein [Sulfuricellaceae bacterium]
MKIPKLGIRGSLWTASLFSGAVLSLLAGENLYTLHQNAASLESVYLRSVVPASALLAIDKQLETSRFNMAAVTFDKVGFTDAARQLAEVKERLPQAWQDFKEAKRGRFTAEESALVATIDQHLATLEPVYKFLDTAYGSQDKIMTRSVLDDDWPKVEEGVLKPMSKLVELQQQHVQDTYTRTVADGDRMRYLVLGTLVIGALIGTLATIISTLLARSMTHGIHQLKEALGRAAAGDFNVRVDYHDENELGETARHLETTLASLRDIILGISRNATALAAEADSLAAIAGHVETRSHTQSEAAEATAAAVEEMLTSIEQVAGNARDSQTISENAAAMSNEGQDIADNAVQEMQSIAASVSETATLITALDHRAQDINQIIQLIKEVAGNTNLLALNAAIEAARAGEQGRGFAVVADEVRKLAERTEQATSEIETMIAAIQSDMHRAVAAMEGGRRQVEKGVELVSHTSASLSAIHEGARKTNLSVGEIADATREQNAASRDIARNVEKIVALAEENRSAINGLAEAVAHLRDLSRVQQEAVARFRV